MAEIPGAYNRSNTKHYYWGIQTEEVTNKTRLATKASEGEEGAKKRTTKTSKVVWERYTDLLTGYLVDVNIQEKEFEGKKIKQLIIKLKPEGVEDILHIININVASRYFSSFCEKLPHLSSGQLITVSPYNFMNERNKMNAGVTVIADQLKLTSFYKESIPDGQGYRTELRHGFPAMPNTWDKMTETQRKIYFLTVEDFFIEKMHEWRAVNAPSYSKESFAEANDPSANEIAPPDDFFVEDKNTKPLPF